MTTHSRQDEGAFGSVLALLVVAGFLALAARLTTDAGPVETIVTDPVDAVVQGDPLLTEKQVVAQR